MNGDQKYTMKGLMKDGDALQKHQETGTGYLDIKFTTSEEGEILMSVDAVCSHAMLEEAIKGIAYKVSSDKKINVVSYMADMTAKIIIEQKNRGE